MAAGRGAQFAGIDAAEELIEISAERTPEGEVRVGDVETLPWSDDSFDWVTGFNAFQFADDKARALAEASRVSKGPVAMVVPSRVADSGVTAVLAAVGLEVIEDEELDTPVPFDSIATAVRAFVAGGPMAVAVQHSGESAVAQVAEEALAAFASSSGDVTLPG